MSASLACSLLFSRDLLIAAGKITSLSGYLYPSFHTRRDLCQSCCPSACPIALSNHLQGEGRGAERGKRHGEGKQGGGEGPYGMSCSIKHTCCLQPLAGQPQRTFSPTGRGCCQTAFQKAAPAAGGLRFAALTIPATLCTTVLRVINPLTPLCGYTC